MSAGAGRRAACLLVLLALAAEAPSAQMPRPKSPPGATPPAATGALRGFTPSWPSGDPARGREAFQKFECYACHEVRGEGFPAPGNREAIGPELSAMGPLHDVHYFLEALVNPSATIERGKGYEAADGSSRMPSYNDSMTVQELVDLVTFLRGLTPPAGTPPAHQH